MNIYKNILQNNINKLLNLYNTDTFSQTYGLGDREYWGWKIKDFANATLQGGVHSLAIAIKLNLFKINEKDKILSLIHNIILATKKITYSNGSLEEAYPQENSFCVTALVAFDLLSAIYHLNLDINQYKNTIEPMINFITKNDEEHAIISNHLATAVAAITIWNYLTNNNNCRDKELLQIIYDNQSSEGWYKEYESADPGYQTLCTYYLFCTYQITKDEKLLSSIKQSGKFLSYFIHPDHTIGGLYGSRNTEVYYPAGIIGLSGEIDTFAMIAKYLEPTNQHILPQFIDIGNYIPLLNSYAVSALYYEENKLHINNNKLKPFYVQNHKKDFSNCGILLYSNKNYFAIINYKKGGVIKVFNKLTKTIDCEDGGLFGILTNKIKFSTQQFDNNITFKNYKLTTKFYKINESYPNALNFLILRFLSLTVFKSTVLGNIFKKFIVNMLMTGKKTINGYAVRQFIFNEDKIIINENIKNIDNLKFIKHYSKAKSIHMASSGYFIAQNFYNQQNNLMEYNLEINC